MDCHAQGLADIPRPAIDEGLGMDNSPDQDHSNLDAPSAATFGPANLLGDTSGFESPATTQESDDADDALGEAQLKDLLDALDAFAEDDARREADRRRRMKERDQSILYAESQHLKRSAAPTLSPGGGRFCAPFMVILSCEDMNASIYYTTDGSTPDPRFALSQPLEITLDPGITQIQAIAISPCMEPSSTVHAKFAVYSKPTCLPVIPESAPVKVSCLI